jgi:hypothetical protein
MQFQNVTVSLVVCESVNYEHWGGTANAIFRVEFCLEGLGSRFVRNAGNHNNTKH